jgi:aminoglycoside/choline kinase family phosphotransferase
MTRPRPEVESYLETVCPGAEITPIGGDASTRSFWRVRLPDGRSRVLMDYGLPFEKETDDVRLARIFREARLPVAEVHEVSDTVGCLLLEDLGERSLEASVAWANGRLRPHARPMIESAVILAARIASSGTPVLARSDRKKGPALDAERFRFEMDFFIEHFVVGLRGLSPPDGMRDALHALADEAADTPRQVLCHRDFHSRNLVVRSGGKLALVDIQDARWGPDSYDLVSLLRDGYIDIEDDWIDPLVELYVSTLDELPAQGFRSRLDRVSAQRMLKALGTFGYQATVRNAPRYLDGVPRTLRRLRDLLPGMAETRPLMRLLSEAGALDDP